MAKTIKTYELQSRSRIDVRREMINLFLEEEPGTGIGDLCSKYQYIVEQYTDKKEYKIYLRRPALLNKGFDFIVYIDGCSFKRNKKYSNPRHPDIIDALSQVKQNVTPEEYALVKSELKKIFECGEYSLERITHICFKDFEGSPHPVAVILLAAKWLFVEQDITYWNWSGRQMLWRGLQNAGLV